MDKEGTLRLAWWEGNEKLKGKAVALKTPALENAPAMLEPQFDVESGFVLEGTLQIPAEGTPQPPGIYLESGEKLPTAGARAAQEASARSERSSRMVPTSSRGQPRRYGPELNKSTARCRSARRPASASWFATECWSFISTTSFSTSAA